ncbi:hypothetical protein G3I44_18715 [Halogeometricum borinquense]|uniref:DUF6760 domain-containing protein n=2 Tax=Halogeometricum borinquense TaxID=60847 RepID=E4NVY0_HALBP|nr:DUF6760 family protein [Halogeometricum borinquense]ADQ69200.1 hypothetical protein Hbor_38860 [Halogeometricum borinquense DSM 11551]ELY31615.1 hypothetical protein C499_00615 [Halogeometricum borinquense DSM 11551]QIB76121.1 hypothetical protein G3I44_18715 [Halogeometricum borinquense]RYJ13323.1 hypothetical protein ELS19_04650 [Halogeometricum borinquense]
MIHLHDPDVLFEEVAFVAYHFGWSRDEVLGMSHWERQRWCEEISDINEEMNANGDTAPGRQSQQQGANFLDTEGGGKVLSKSLDELRDE